MGVVPERAGRMLWWDLDGVVGALTRCHHAERVGALAGWGDVQAVRVQVRRLGEPVLQSQPDQIAGAHEQGRAG